MNEQLLEQVKAHILAEPKRLDMGNWGKRASGSDAPACGTTGCIAGWAAFLSNPYWLAAEIGAFERYCASMDSAARVDATHLLDLSDFQQGNLFFVENWPEEFNEAFIDAERNGDKEEMANVTALRIEHFIKTKGKE